MGFLQYARQVYDNWQSTLLGLGTDRDKVTSYSYWSRGSLNAEELSSMYHEDDVAGRIVDIRPKEMLRQGYEVCGLDPDQSKALTAKFALLGAQEKVLEAITWGRLYGGSILIMGALDGQMPDAPLREDSIQDISYLTVVDRRYVRIESYYSDPMLPNFREPEVYTISSPDSRYQGVRVHASRCIRFRGAMTDHRKQQENGGWDLSVLQRPYEAMRAFAAGYASVSHLLTDASQGVFKMSGLVQAIISGQKNLIQERMALVDMNRSVSRAILLDKDSGEEFERKATSFAGLPETLDKLMLRLAAAAELPVTILMGQSPAGMNATGESDFQWFYDSIRTDQKNVLEPKLLRLLTCLLLAKSGPTGGKVPKDLGVEWCKLKQMTPLEQATLEKTTAERDVAYINAQVLLPEEVAISRFGKGRWSPETDINVEAREKLLASEEAFLRDPETEDPSADPEDTPDATEEEVTKTPKQGEEKK